MLGTALNSMGGRDFLLLPSANGAALFETTVLEVDQSLDKAWRVILRPSGMM